TVLKLYPAARIRVAPVQWLRDVQRNFLEVVNHRVNQATLGFPGWNVVGQNDVITEVMTPSQH
ncbi:hypothetical protein QIG51_26585, partial [Klebsiella pneumoniae]|nr:hypothetical protein [Klebsiella pneumoniae]